MKTYPETTVPSSVGQEPEEEITPEAGHGKMPLVLLGLWFANVSFFVFYFIRYGWADLVQWVNK